LAWSWGCLLCVRVAVWKLDSIVMVVAPPFVDVASLGPADFDVH
jgi:hypothetical protein